MYEWRRMTQAERDVVLRERRDCYLPWHSPLHRISDETTYYHITAACFDHRPIIGFSPTRMAKFELEWLAVLSEQSNEVFAWVVLPNHCHALLRTSNLRELLKQLGRLHGRTSFFWNREDHEEGRQVWFNAVETAIKSERHFWATMNYVLNNPVRHGYVERWQDWPYSNATEYLNQMGRERAAEIWREFPVLDYGAEWDPPEL